MLCSTRTRARRASLATGRLVYSRCSFDRVPHAVGELYGDRNVDIDDAPIDLHDSAARNSVDAVPGGGSANSFLRSTS